MTCYDHMAEDRRALKLLRKADKRRDWHLYLALALLLLASCATYKPRSNTRPTSFGAVKEVGAPTVTTR